MFRSTRTGTVFVAASGAQQISQTETDFLCDGTADDVEIQAAVDSLPDGGGMVVLSEGTFTLSATIIRAIDNVTFFGMGMGTRLINNASTVLISDGGQAGWAFIAFDTDAGDVTASGSGVVSDYWLDGVRQGVGASHSETHILATSGPHTSQLPISDLGDLAKIGSSTFSTVQHLQDIFHSSGWVTGGAVTDAGSETVNVAAGTGCIRTADSRTGEILFFDWPAVTAQAIATGATRYVGVEYNAGTPQVVVRTSENFDNQTAFLLAFVVNEATVLHISQTEHAVGDHANQMLQRLTATNFIARDNRAGGLILGETGARKVTMSAGTLWSKLNSFAISAIDTSVSGSFDRYYRKVGDSGWNIEAAQTDWPEAQYDDNSGTLVTMTNNRWSALYFYLELDGDIAMVYGQAEYTSQAMALNDTPPPSLPDRLTITGTLIGRYIFQKDAAAPDTIESAFSVSFGGTGVTDHGSLSGLGDDDHDIYILADGTRAFSGNVDMSLNEIINHKTENLGALPGSGNLGRLVYLTTDNHLYLDQG